MSGTANHSSEVRLRRIVVLLPLVVFVGLMALFLFRLNSGDPSLIPSALIGRPVPQTALPPVAGLKRGDAPVPGLDPASFKGAVSVVNVWASWCVPCHDEAPLLMQLAQDSRLRLVGINYKDDADNARRFLGHYVYGVPETFVIGRDARIAYKLVGPITPDNFDSVLKPQIEKALAAGS